MGQSEVKNSNITQCAKKMKFFFYFRYDYCKDNLTPYLKKVGFNPAKDVQFMPCSGLTGAGLKEPCGSDAPWYT